jgi:hypothetical protein
MTLLKTILSIIILSVLLTSRVGASARSNNSDNCNLFLDLSCSLSAETNTYFDLNKSFQLSKSNYTPCENSTCSPTISYYNSNNNLDFCLFDDNCKNESVQLAPVVDNNSNNFSSQFETGQWSNTLDTNYNFNPNYEANTFCGIFNNCPSTSDCPNPVFVLQDPCASYVIPTSNSYCPQVGAQECIDIQTPQPNSKCFYTVKDGIGQEFCDSEFTTAPYPNIPTYDQPIFNLPNVQTEYTAPVNQNPTTICSEYASENCLNCDAQDGATLNKCLYPGNTTVEQNPENTPPEITTGPFSDIPSFDPSVFDQPIYTDPIRSDPNKYDNATETGSIA